jgi:hypothetical protein
MRERKSTDYGYKSDREHVEDYLDDIGKGNVIASIWMIEDVQGRAEESGYFLTDDECRDVLSYLNNKHDACIGINWDVIDYWVEVVVNDRG